MNYLKEKRMKTLRFQFLDSLKTLHITYVTSSLLGKQRMFRKLVFRVFKNKDFKLWVLFFSFFFKLKQINILTKFFTNQQIFEAITNANHRFGKTLEKWVEWEIQKASFTACSELQGAAPPAGGRMSEILIK